MMYLTKNRFSAGSGRSARMAFTFIELVVAIALSIILLRGMYTIFHSAIRLTRLSEEKMVAMLEISAIFDYLAGDIARSPTATDNYYLEIPADRKSITFQAMRLDGVTEKQVYVKFYLSGTDLMRKVLGNDNATQATEADDGEDGSTIKIAHNIAEFQVWYFDNTKDDINAAGAWTLTATLPPGSPPDPATADDLRTRAVKFKVTIQSQAEDGLVDQTFIQIFPIMY